MPWDLDPSAPSEPSPTNFEIAVSPVFLTCSSNFFLSGSTPSGIRESNAYIRCRSSSLSKSSRFWKLSHMMLSNQHVLALADELFSGLHIEIAIHPIFLLPETFFSLLQIIRDAALRQERL